MPRKLNFPAELKALRNVPADKVHPLTTRVPTTCLRKLYRICERENLDLSALVRQILEEQAESYLEPGRLRSGPREAGAGVLVQLPEGIQGLLNKACEGLAVDAATLLRLIVTDALPGWVLRAGRAQQQRHEALARLEGRLTPELAVWRAHCRLAPAPLAGHLGAVSQLVEEGAVRLEVGGDGELYVELAAEAGGEGKAGADQPGANALRELAAAGALVPERPDGPWGRWRLEPRAFFQPAEQEKGPPSSGFKAAEQEKGPPDSGGFPRRKRNIDHK
jgi:hypothetical protein